MAEQKKDAVKQGMAKRLSARRRYLRKQNHNVGWTQEDVAQMLSEARGLYLSRTAYAHYETGENEIAASDVAYLAQILSVPVGYLYGEVDEEDQAKSDLGRLANSVPETAVTTAQAVLRAIIDAHAADEE